MERRGNGTDTSRDGGRRARCVHRRGAPYRGAGSTTGSNWWRARSPSTAEKSRASGADLGAGPGPGLRRLQRDGAARGAAEGGNKTKGGGDRDPEPHALPAARKFLKRGIHVICDKPLTSTPGRCKESSRARRRRRTRFSCSPTITPATRWCGSARAMGGGGRHRGPSGWCHGRVPPGLLNGGRGTTSRPSGDRPRAVGGGGGRRRIRNPRLSNPREFRDGARARGAVGGYPGFRAGPDRVELQRPRVLALRRRGAGDALGRARSRRQTEKRAAGFGSTADRAVSNGRRRTRPTSGSRRFGEPKRAHHPGRCGVGERGGRVSRVPPGHPEGYLEGLSRRSIPRRPRRSASPVWPNASRPVVYPTVAGTA